MALPQRLLAPAKLLFEAANKANVPAILFGGAAVVLNGGLRDTRDLDVNVTSLKFKDKLSSEFSFRTGSSESRLRVTYNHPSQAIKCDVATDHAALVVKVIHHTAVRDGIRYALPNLLLADKIRTYSERRTRYDAKRESDLEDITFLIGVMMSSKETMPDDLKSLILTDEVLANFWQVLPDAEKVTYKDFLAELGVIVGA